MMDSQNIKITGETHKKLVDFITENPLLKIGYYADSAILEKIHRDTIGDSVVMRLNKIEDVLFINSEK